jgi:hypothetical protein
MDLSYNSENYQNHTQLFPISWIILQYIRYITRQVGINDDIDIFLILLFKLSLNLFLIRKSAQSTRR